MQKSRKLEVAVLLALVACGFLFFQKPKESSDQVAELVAIEEKLDRALELGGEATRDFFESTPLVVAETLASPFDPSDASSNELALKLANRRVESNPDSARAYRKRAWLFRDLGELDKAMGDLEKAIELEPNHKETLWLESSLKFGADDIDSALIALERLSKIEPNDPKVLEYQAHYNAQAGHFEQALAHLQEYEDNGTDKIWADSYAGFCFVGLGRDEEAIESYSKVLSEDPKHKSALRGRAIAFRRIGNASDSELDLAQLKAIDPDFCLHWKVDPDPGRHSSEDKSILTGRI